MRWTEQTGFSSLEDKTIIFSTSFDTRRGFLIWTCLVNISQRWSAVCYVFFFSLWPHLFHYKQPLPARNLLPGLNCMDDGNQGAVKRMENPWKPVWLDRVWVLMSLLQIVLTRQQLGKEINGRWSGTLSMGSNTQHHSRLRNARSANHFQWKVWVSRRFWVSVFKTVAVMHLYTSFYDCFQALCTV